MTRILFVIFFLAKVQTWSTVNVLKFWTLFTFCFQRNCGLLGLEFTKTLTENQTGKTQIRLLLQKQSDLGLCCLSRPLWLATSVWNFRTLTRYSYFQLRIFIQIFHWFHWIWVICSLIVKTWHIVVRMNLIGLVREVVKRWRTIKSIWSVYCRDCATAGPRPVVNQKVRDKYFFLERIVTVVHYCKTDGISFSKIAL